MVTRHSQGVRFRGVGGIYGDAWRDMALVLNSLNGFCSSIKIPQLEWWAKVGLPRRLASPEARARAARSPLYCMHLQHSRLPSPSKVILGYRD